MRIRHFMRLKLWMTVTNELISGVASELFLACPFIKTALRGRFESALATIVPAKKILDAGCGN